jgi:hypothetical protein
MPRKSSWPLVLPCGCRFDQVEIAFGVRALVLTECPAGEECKWVRFAMARRALLKLDTPHAN